MRNVLPGGGTISISGRDARALIAARDGNAALLYLHILAGGGALSYAGAAQALGCSEQEIRRAMGVLGNLGLVEAPRTAQPQPMQREELPEYSAADIHREMQSGSAFAGLVEEVQRIYGRLLSSDGLRKLFGIYDSLGMAPEAILMLVTHCMEEYRRKNGSTRLPTMGYVEKAAFAWHSAGVYTLEQAEQYLRVMDERRGLQKELRRLLGIRDREPSPTEQKYIEKWAAMGFGQDVIALAYDRTVMQTGKLAWRYMDSILTSWQQNGLRTTEDIETGDSPAPSRGRQTARTPASGEQSGESANELEELRRFLTSMGGSK